MAVPAGPSQDSTVWVVDDEALKAVGGAEVAISGRREAVPLHIEGRETVPVLVTVVARFEAGSAAGALGRFRGVQKHIARFARSQTPGARMSSISGFAAVSQGAVGDGFDWCV